MTFTHPLAGNPDAAELRRKAGDYLKALREAAGLTQLDLAKALGLSYYSTVSQVELGKSRLPPHRMADWSKALGADRRAFGKRMLMYYDPHTWEILFGRRGDSQNLLTDHKEE